MRSSLALVAALVPAALAAECSPFELVYGKNQLTHKTAVYT